MTLLIMVVAVAAPSLANFFRGRSLDSEARRLLSLTRYGQSRAVFDGIPMLLWLDAKQRAYGLEEEAGFTDLDTKALQFPLDREVGMEVVNLAVPRAVNINLAANTMMHTGAGAYGSFHRGLPTIRFLPDGTVSETSPQMVRLLDSVGAELWLVQSSNRLNYEIRNQFNAWNHAQP